MSVYSPERREAARQRALAAMNRVPVDPSLEEIAERCEEIQRGWSRRERRYREATIEPWTAPELCCVDYCEG